MLLVLLRHGIAALPEKVKNEEVKEVETDAARPLTPVGRRKTRQAAQGLKIWLKNVDLLASSPKLRALQTAHIVAEVCRAKAPQVWPELAADDLELLWKKLQECGVQKALLVGHEPHLSRFAAQLLTGRENGLVLGWKKAGACVLEVDLEADLELGTAELVGFYAPKVLRRAAGLN